MSAISNLSEFQIITLWVIGTISVVFPLAAVLAGCLGVMQRKA